MNSKYCRERQKDRNHGDQDQTKLQTYLKRLLYRLYYPGHCKQFRTAAVFDISEKLWDIFSKDIVSGYYKFWRSAASDSYPGLRASIILYAIGGGLLEVLVSPIVEACPTEKKEAAMSLLHSFYCWGHMGVVILSTAFFFVFGIDKWQMLAVIWAAVPLANALYFMVVPIRTLAEEEEGLSIRTLSGRTVFWILMVLMICAGASEQAVSQWASAFAESALHVSKSIGDLAGPCAFAFFMGTSRVVSAKLSEKLSLEKIMLGSAGLCVVSYLMISLSPWPVLSLAGCALCGFAVGALWPSTFSLAMKKIPGGGTAMFALFALAGDIGCAGGPLLVGRISGIFGDDLRTGILAALVFPILLILGVLASGKMREEASVALRN